MRIESPWALPLMLPDRLDWLEGVDSVLALPPFGVVDFNVQDMPVLLASSNRGSCLAQQRIGGGLLALWRMILVDQSSANGVAATVRRACSLGVVAACAALSLANGACAQSLFGDDSRPIFGGTGGLAPVQKPAFGGMSGPSAPLHRDGYGHVCIGIQGYAEPQKANPNIFNHMLLIINGCHMPIKLHVCYYHSDHCADVVAAPYDRTIETLGIFPHMQDFRWEYTEGSN